MPPGSAETLQPRRDVDPVAVDLLALDHHVAEVDADAKLHPALGGRLRILGLERGLHIDRALDGIDHAGELGQDAIAGGVYEASVMLLDESSRLSCDERYRVRSVASSSLPHEAAVAEYVGAEYGGELTFHTHPRQHRPAECGGLSIRTRKGRKNCFCCWPPLVRAAKS